jgi:hypothetical protein
LSGGQYSLQVAGFLAVNASAVPPVVVETSHSVREVYAVLGTSADSEVKVQVNVNGAAYCTLKFIAGLTLSDAKDGNALPPLLTGDRITLSLLSVGVADAGADLTVLIRL